MVYFWYIIYVKFAMTKLIFFFSVVVKFKNFKATKSKVNLENDQIKIGLRVSITNILCLKIILV